MTTTTETLSGQRWTGTHISGSQSAVVVRYAGPTDRRGSRWIATLKRDSQTVWRAAVPFADGPIAAAQALLTKQGLNWQVRDCCSIDSDTYCLSVG